MSHVTYRCHISNSRKDLPVSQYLFHLRFETSCHKKFRCSSVSHLSYANRTDFLGEIWIVFTMSQAGIKFIYNCKRNAGWNFTCDFFRTDSIFKMWAWEMENQKVKVGLLYNYNLVIPSNKRLWFFSM